MDFTIGEVRRASAGNLYRLEKIYDALHVGVRRIGVIGHEGCELWDNDIVYRWLYFQWDSIPLVGEDVRDYPHFGVFIP